VLSKSVRFAGGPKFQRQVGRRITMKRMVVLLAMLGLAALNAHAQTVTGSGTTGKIPQFTGSSTIGDSNIFQSPDGNIGIGSTFPPVPLYVYSTNPAGPPGYSPIAMWVESTADNASALWAVSSSPVGGIAVNGNAHGAQGNGVLGNYLSSTGGGGGGVIGLTNSADFGFSYATRGTATASTGSAVAIFGETSSPDGWPAYFVNRARGNLMIGVVGQNPDVPVFRVDGTGKVFANGGFRPFGADFAESVAVKGDSEHYAPGDLLVIDASGERRLSLSQAPYSTLVAGIYSTQPGVVASTHRVDEALPNNEIPLAVVGIVPCKVTAENGPVTAGDLLVTSSTPGYAMKGTDRSKMLGAVVGKALEPLQQGTGIILILVTLQ
jgi:hypothetical protein